MSTENEKAECAIAFEDWCEVTAQVVNEHGLDVLVLPDKRFAIACKSVAGIVPNHYAAPERIADILHRLGKEKSAAYLRVKLPELPKIRSGDLGEILATEYIGEKTPYRAPINRLRWKDHRNMPLRGDDVIGIASGDGEASLSFLKSEVKSRKSLATSVVVEAREALNADNGLPSPHALAFVSDRLHEIGQDDLADRITLAQLQDGISAKQVRHLLFTFSANAPNEFLKADLEKYDGSIPQSAVGLHIVKHQEFIAAVYQIVEADNES